MNDKSAAYRKYTFGMGQDFQPQALCKQNSASDLDLTGVADSPIRKNRKSKSSNNSSASIASNAKDIDSDFENPFLDRSHSNSQNVEPN